MKRIFVLLFALAVVLGLYVQTHATLIDRGTDSLGYHLIYDTDLNITWYDYTESGNTWQNQVNWAAGLTVNFGGNTYHDWRLPRTVDGPYVEGYDGTTTAGYNITSSEMGHLFYTELGNKGFIATDGTYPQPGWGLKNTGPFTNLQKTNFYPYWSGTERAADPATAWNFIFAWGSQDWGYKAQSDLYALAVRPGDVSSTVDLQASILKSYLEFISIPNRQSLMDRMINICSGAQEGDCDAAQRDLQEFNQDMVSKARNFAIDITPLVTDINPIPTSDLGLLAKLLTKAKQIVEFGVDYVLLLLGLLPRSDFNVSSVEGTIGSFDLDAIRFDWIKAEITAEVDKDLLTYLSPGTQFFNDISLFDAQKAVGVATITNVIDPPEFGTIVISLEQIEMTPVPEPSSILLLSSGLAGCGWLAYRYRLKK